ncbi:hypothetical protein FQA39_LY12700 [Lamprigera yunnana]|nr:hypothetical protein FQA39_LY12700 [Lamprigera yunnana]
MEHFENKSSNTVREDDKCKNRELINDLFVTNEHEVDTTIHPQISEDNKLIEKLDKKKSCYICSKTFKFDKSFKRHLLLHKEDQQLWCKYCMKYFPTKERKELHVIEKHEKKIKKHKCKICLDATFDTEEEYFVHINEVHKGRCHDYHMCSDCGKQFKRKTGLLHHNQSKCGTIKQYTCEICGRKLMSAGSLYNHMLQHTQNSSHMCGYCGKMFLTTGQLKVHERTHTQDKAFICNVCSKGFCHRQSLITHSTLHTGIKPYQCENCGNTFSCVGNLIKHRKIRLDSCGAVPLTNHKVDNPSTKMKVKINTPETSKLKTVKKEKERQDKLSAYKKKLEKKTENGDVKHIDEIDDDLVIDNDASDVELKTEPESIISNEDIALKEDTPKITEAPPIRDDAEPQYQLKTLKRKQPKSEKEAKRDFVKDLAEYTCRFCKKTCADSSSLLWHERKHRKRKSTKFNKCSCCKMSFDSKEACREHKEEKHANLLSCLDCNKIFSNIFSLRNHHKIVHKGLPRKVYIYMCEKCGMQFRQKTLLKIHENNNCTSGCIYECHVCGKGFNSIYTRASHLRVHDPKKKFLCKYCGKNFRWKGQLKVHERSHTGEKPFKCLYCPKAFAYRESLVTHSSLHTGIKPHLCEACGSRFSCIGNLIKHRTTHVNTCGMWNSKH